ncbi:Pimeloyl-ACP methyl ester carboxylesterase [Kaistia soli DSM 19436]|uniref:Pimeloyl-ACP methyl ester carboxylesterase n=1 Tax=Kaistia soli DSM 19436 TaxID=1122133 RepID=A0A1M5GYC8_9HYPH|nr:alpha/beta hydrolase [Kaistia soli]SHG08750.1 Pimeloyl-ACP methyl ester carboxylesterase [Kaistia soli DSM 19436]
MTPILLVPGLLCTSEVFTPQIPALWPYGPVTIASTSIGTTMAEMAAAILADAPPRFALGGISMGGYLAFEIMRQAPGRVTRLALISTSARPDTPDQTAARRAMVAAARRDDFAALIAASTTAIMHPDQRGDASLVATNVRMGLVIGIEGFARQQEAVIGRPDSLPDLAAITVPTTVIVGDSDPLAPPERAAEIAAGVAGARLVTIPRCGHCSALEQPEAVNQALVDWINAAAG